MKINLYLALYERKIIYSISKNLLPNIENLKKNLNVMKKE